MRAFARAGIPSRRALAPASDLEHRLRASIPFVRDLLFIGAILVYVIGFAYQTAMIGQLGGVAVASEQQLPGVLAWAGVALRDGALAYAGIAATSLALVGSAALVRREWSGRAFCRPIAYAILVVAVLVLVVGSSWFAWHEGSIANVAVLGTSRD